MIPAFTILPVTIYRLQRAAGGYEDFPNLTDAQRRRDELDAIDRANAVLDDGGTLLAAHEAAGPALWLQLPAELHGVTKAAGFKIPHWQCCDSFVYRIASVYKDGQIEVYGTGSWRGGYGEVLPPYKLAHYAWQPVADDPVKP